jgi:hypothetical protein
MRLSSLELQLAQQGTTTLQLQKQMLTSYAPLLLDVAYQHEIRSSIDTGGVLEQPLQLNAVTSFRQQPMCHHVFELQQQQQQCNGWVVPSYSVYLHDSGDAAAAAAEGQQQQTQMDSAADSLLKLLPGM